MAEIEYIGRDGRIIRLIVQTVADWLSVRKISEETKRSSRNAFKLKFEPIQLDRKLRITRRNLECFETDSFHEAHQVICDYLKEKPNFKGFFLVKINGGKPKIVLFAHWEDIYPNIAVPPVILNARASALAIQIPSYNTEHRPGRFEPVKRLKERNQCRRNTNRLNQTIRDAKWTVNSSRRLDTEVYDQLEEVCT